MISPLPRDHVGKDPPAVEICHFPPGPGNGRTYTSKRPDSSESYASHRPSGEKAALASENGLLRKTTGFPGFHTVASSPVNGRIRMSERVFGHTSLKAKKFPLGCHDAGDCGFSLSVRRSASPLPPPPPPLKFFF